MRRPTRDTFTVTQQPDGTWVARMHGFRGAEFYGATASEALSNAGRATDHAASFMHKWWADMADESARATGQEGR